jgi:hypothetical protein
MWISLGTSRTNSKASRSVSPGKAQPSSSARLARRVDPRGARSAPRLSTAGVIAYAAFAASPCRTTSFSAFANLNGLSNCSSRSACGIANGCSKGGPQNSWSFIERQTWTGDRLGAVDRRMRRLCTASLPKAEPKERGQDMLELLVPHGSQKEVLVE